ncbi:MAG: reverse transcriptase domain-containing protein [Sedimenticola sp.]
MYRHICVGRAKKPQTGAQEVEQVNTGFKAGRLKDFAENWRKITNDETILNIVQNCSIDFIDDVNPINTRIPPCYFSATENFVIDNEIQTLLNMGVIIEVNHEPDEYLSPIFIVPKRNGEYRMILNLKQLNEYIVYHHFKMDTFESSLKLIKHNCWMSSIDLRHAYYSVPMLSDQQNKLRFVKSGKVYQYVCLPNGISCAPRIFTKLMKPIYASLRQLGHSNSGYIDDSLLVGDTSQECEKNVMDTVDVMESVGFIIHEKKSVFKPTQSIDFLGNHINSVDMVVTLPQRRVDVIVQECKEMQKLVAIPIRQTARVLGLMVSSFSAVEFAPLHYRTIEREKTKALKISKGKFDQKMLVTCAIKLELNWWIENLNSQKRVIDHGNADILIVSDASLSGWGAICNGSKIGGRWKPDECDKHINCLEMLAALIGLKAFCREHHDTHVQIQSDNTCTVAYINNMGGIKSEQCNELAVEMWSWCIQRRIWLSATHIPGHENQADHYSRNFNENIEWMLDRNTFLTISHIWGLPEMDMFASRANNQIQRYVSWKQDPNSEHVNAFTFNWSSIYFYAFPPFSLIGRAVQKLRRDRAECIMIIPLWPTQVWYPTVMELLVDHPVIISMTSRTLSIPNTDKVHPLSKRLHLVACRLSGKPLQNEVFQNTLPISSWRPGAEILRNSIQCISSGGFSTVIKNRLIQFKRM